jgi:hypothetical protein
MMERSDYCFNTGIVRPVARSIEQALRLEEPDTPIHFEVAKKQHQKYTEILKSLIPNVIEVLISQHIFISSIFRLHQIILQCLAS